MPEDRVDNRQVDCVEVCLAASFEVFKGFKHRFNVHDLVDETLEVDILLMQFMIVAHSLALIVL